MNVLTRIGVVAGVFILTALTACSSIDFNHDWDRDAAFGNYHTYGWLQRNQKQSYNTLIDKRIQAAVSEEMTARGLTLNAENPDILLTFHIGLQDKINVTDYGYRYSYDYWGWGNRSIDVYQYTEGTLVIDIVDANTKELVWRGSGTKTVDESSSPEKVEATINTAVAGILSKFPPPK